MCKFSVGKNIQSFNNMPLKYPRLQIYLPTAVRFTQFKRSRGNIDIIHENRGERGDPLKKIFYDPPPKISRPPLGNFWPPYVVKFAFFQIFLKKLKIFRKKIQLKNVGCPDWSETCRNAIKSDKNFGVGGTPLQKIPGPPGF